MYTGNNQIQQLRPVLWTSDEIVYLISLRECPVEMLNSACQKCNSFVLAVTMEDKNVSWAWQLSMSDWKQCQDVGLAEDKELKGTPLQTMEVLVVTADNILHVAFKVGSNIKGGTIAKYIAQNGSKFFQWPQLPRYLPISTGNCIILNWEGPCEVLCHIILPILGKPHPFSSSKIHLLLKNSVQFCHQWKYIPQRCELFSQIWSFLRCPY